MVILLFLPIICKHITMRIKFLLLFVMASLLAKAQNIEVSGLQSGTWDADTVFVTGDVYVQENLEISSGTTVVFNGFYGISVRKGSISALGTENEPVVFTVPDTTGFHIYNSGRGGWNGITLDLAQQAKFYHCVFQYGKAADTLRQHGGALEIINCKDVELTNSVLRCNFAREHGGALNAEHSNVKMSNCSVIENKLYTKDNLYFMYGGGLRFINCDVEMTDMDFRNNYGEISIGGALSLDSCSVKIDRAVFEDNIGLNGAGLYIMRCNDKECSISNCLFANNHAGHFGGGLAFSNASPEVSNITVVGNSSDGVNCGGIFFYENSSPVMRNIIVTGNYNVHPEMPDVQMWVWTFEPEAPLFYNGLVQGGLDSISGFEHITVYENMIDADPLFVNPENYDFHLSENSPCRDAGDPNTNPIVLNGIDLDGMPRVINERIDMGAYEYSGTGIDELVGKNNVLNIIGNPLTINSFAEISLNEASPVSAKIYSMTGALLWEKDFGFRAAGQQKLQIGEFASVAKQGIYLIEIKAQNEAFVGKTMKY